MCDPVDGYTQVRPRPLKSYIRTRDASVDGHQEGSALPLANLVRLLEQHVLRKEKRWVYVATAFDDSLGFATASCYSLRTPPSCAARLPMPPALSPFSLSAMFYEIQSADNSLNSTQDTSADLSLYGWLSAQGAQTILPGPPPAMQPPPRSIRRVGHIISNETKGLSRDNDDTIVFPLSPPPTVRIPTVTKLNCSPHTGHVSAEENSHLVEECVAHDALLLDKPLPALPISPPESPDALTKDQFCDAHSEDSRSNDYHPPRTTARNYAYDRLINLEDEDDGDAYDFDNALSRNLALQHASAAAVRQYRLVVQELKWGVISQSLPGSRTTKPQRVAFQPLPAAGAALEDMRVEHEIATILNTIPPSDTQERADKSSTSSTHPQDGSARQFAVLLTRQAADEEMDAEHLRALATRLDNMARQRKVLATSVVQCGF